MAGDTWPEVGTWWRERTTKHITQVVGRAAYGGALWVAVRRPHAGACTLHYALPKFWEEHAALSEEEAAAAEASAPAWRRMGMGENSWRK